MLKNCVFKQSVNTMKWVKAASKRAVKTMAQAMLGGIGAAVTIGQVDWKYVISAAALAGVASVLTSVVGIPEVEEEK